MFEGINPINTPRHSFKNIKEAKTWAKGNIVGIYKNNDTGEDIRISNLSIGKYLSKKAVEQSINIDAHLSALKQMPSLIKIALLTERVADKENNEVTEIYKKPADIRQGSTSPLSYIESLTPLTDDQMPNPNFLSVAAILPAPESCQPVAKKRSTDFPFRMDNGNSILPLPHTLIFLTAKIQYFFKLPKIMIIFFRK